MAHDAEAEVHAEALGVIESLSAACLGSHCAASLASAHEVLLNARPADDVTVAAAVGAHRRASDFKKLQSLLLELSLSPGVIRKDIVLAMMYVTQAEGQWVKPRDNGRGLARLRRRQGDRDEAVSPMPRQVG